MEGRPTKRICLTELGKQRHPRMAEREGEVFGPSRYPGSVRVLWDGCRTPMAMHRSYIQPIPRGRPAPAAQPEQPASPPPPEPERRWTPPRRR